MAKGFHYLGKRLQSLADIKIYQLIYASALYNTVLYIVPNRIRRFSPLYLYYYLFCAQA